MQWKTVKDNPLPKSRAFLAYKKGQIHFICWDSEVDFYASCMSLDPDTQHDTWEYAEAMEVFSHWMKLPNKPRSNYEVEDV
jgi:hypothetical protein